MNVEPGLYLKIMKKNKFNVGERFAYAFRIVIAEITSGVNYGQIWQNDIYQGVNCYSGQFQAICNDKNWKHLIGQEKE